LGLCTAEVRGSTPLRSTTDLQGNFVPSHPDLRLGTPSDNPMTNKLGAARWGLRGQGQGVRFATSVVLAPQCDLFWEALSR